MFNNNTLYYFLPTIKETFEIASNLKIYFYLCFVLAMILCFYLYYFLIRLIFELKNKTGKYKHFVIYFLIMLIFLILTWPGIFKGDEFWLLGIITKFGLLYSQHYLTNIFYMISLLIIPTIGGITLIQIFIISNIVNVILKKIETKLKNKKLIYFFYIPLLLPPVIDNNLFTLRSSLLSFIFLLLIFKIIYYEKENKKDTYSILCLSGLLGAIRNEYIFLIVLIPLLIILLKKENIKKFLKYIVVSLLIFVCINIPQKNGNYLYTSVLNPLSVLATYDNIKETISIDDVENIEKILPFSVLKDYSTILNIPVYFANKINPNVSKIEIVKFFISTGKLFLNNLDRFFDARWQTFKYTNGFEKKYPNHTGHEDFTAQWTLKLGDNHYVYNHFKWLDNPFGMDFKKNIICLILMRNPDTYEGNALFPITYNVLPILLGIFVVLGISIYKKKVENIFICLFFVGSIIITFLLAPANFWMYYVPTYICGNVFICYLLVKKIDKRKSN